MVKKRHLNADELKIYEELEAQHNEGIKTAKARLKELEQDPEYDGSIYVQHDCDGMRVAMEPCTLSIKCSSQMVSCLAAGLLR